VKLSKSTYWLIVLAGLGFVYGWGWVVGYRQGVRTGQVPVIRNLSRLRAQPAVVTQMVTVASAGERERLDARLEAFEFETREGRFAAVALAEQNEMYRRRLEETLSEIEELTAELAEEKWERDRLQADWDEALRRSARMPPAKGLRGAGPILIMDVNRPLRLVVLDRGARLGLVPGMTFNVLREDAYIGRVRVVDVREGIAGATVEVLAGEGFPAVGDRVIPVRDTTP